MIGMLAKLRALLGGPTPPTEEESEAEALRIGQLFRRKHTSFRLLLTSGKRLYSTLEDMEHALTDGRVFGMTFLRAGATSVAVNAFRMLTHLRELDPGATERVSARLTEILSQVEGVLGRRTPLAGGDMAVDLRQVQAARADEVGARLAELGEVKNRLGLPVPEGFVTGGVAYEAFAGHQGLREEIERRLQSFSVGACALAESAACALASPTPGEGLGEGDDEESLLSMEDVGAEVGQLIEDWAMPPELERSLVDAARELCARTGCTHVSVIPASMGEGQAFVGRYPAQFGVPVSQLPQAWRRAVAGKYSPEAMLCRLWRGLPDAEVRMCVGILAEPPSLLEPAPGTLPYARGLALSRSRVLPAPDLPGSLAGAEAVRILTIAAPGKPQNAPASCPVCLVQPGASTTPSEVHFCAPPQGQDFGAEDFSLSRQQAEELGRLARDLEARLGAPVEFEWRLGPDGCFEVLRCGPQFAPPGAVPGAPPPDLRAEGGHSRMEGTPVHRRLSELLELLSPDTLPAPEDPGFRAAHSKTVRDLARVIHARAVSAMFDFGRSQQDFSERAAKQLWAGGSAMQWWIINLGDAFRAPPEGKFIRLENIDSPPFQAVWDGISAFPWAGPPPVDARGFLSIMYESTTNPEISITGDFDFGVWNHILLSRAYVSLSSRFGYHFVTIEALVGERSRENFVNFQFRGGAAEVTRRARRIQFVSGILREFGFAIRVRDDALTARVEALSTAEFMDRLKVLGYLIIHTRQLDMIMRIPEQVRLHREKILREIGQMLAKDDALDSTTGPATVSATAAAAENAP